MIDPKILRAEATGSAAEKWCNCPASIAMEHGIIEEPKDYTDDGTRLHGQVARALTGDDSADIELDQAARFCVDTVRRFLPGRALNIEERLGLLGSSGGIDCYETKKTTGYIVDYKFGIGKKVEAHENHQLAFYACALKERFHQLTRIFGVIVQPRIPGIFDEPSISTWTLNYRDLKRWRGIFYNALIEVEKAEQLKAGPWCQFCKARGGCPAQVVYAEAARQSQEVFEDYFPAPRPEILPAEYVPRVAQLLRQKAQVQAWFAKAEEWLLFHAKNGAEIPGFQLKRKRANRRWKEIMPEEEIAEILKERGIEPYKQSLIPFTKAEEVANIDDLLEKPEGGWTLKEKK